MSLNNYTGAFPNKFKSTFAKALLKKSNLDSNDLKNYRPISNFLFLFKHIERVIAHRLLSHHTIHYLMSNFQSAYRKFHFCESTCSPTCSN